MKKTRIAVQATDPLSYAGLAGYLRRRPDLELLTDAKVTDADVVVVAVACVNATVMEQLRQLAATTTARIVLVLDRLGDADVLAAIEVGVAGVLWRSEASADRLVRVVLVVSQGGCELPVELQGKLVADVSRLQREVLAPRGLTASGLEAREVDVLRLVAAGMDTGEIAKKMMYSERTIKGILYNLMTRLNLRNRAHAVAYAMRSGIL